MFELLERSLEGIDFRCNVVRATVIAGSCALYTLIYFLCSALSRALSSTYTNLPAHQKAFWCLAATRAVFGVYATVGSMYGIVYHHEWLSDLRYETNVSAFLIQSSLGFFFFECGALFISNRIHQQTSESRLALHHILSVATFSVFTFTPPRTPAFFGVVCLFFEISTPLTCVSWMLLKAGYHKTLYWKINQHAMVHAFHLRQFLCYAYIITIWRFRDFFLSGDASMFGTFLILLDIVALTFYINPFWLVKKTTQLLTPVDWNFDSTAASTNGSAKNKLN